LERVGTWVGGSEPAALQVLVGEEEFPGVLAALGPAWAAIVNLGTLAAILANGKAVPSMHAAPCIVIVVGVLLLSVLPVFIWARRNPASWSMFAIPGIIGAALASAIIGLMGPLHQESAAFVPAFAALAFVVANRRMASIVVGGSIAGYGIGVLAVDGFVDAPLRIGIVLVFSVATGVPMAWTVDRLQALAARERSAAAEVQSLAAELLDTNQRLEERVAEQVERIDSLGRLERFLSPQVAQAVLSADDAALLEPHRRQIAVLFCDLRGFTAFTANADPEEVVDLLGDYYAAAGDLIRRHGATMGSFLGDGVMAYFNDPFPCDDPPWEAVSMAQDLRHPLRTLALRWQAKGFHLGFGIGVAWGYATLGTFGFEGRSDYTALSTVVNLASRLCAQAQDGEILLDARAHDAVSDRVTAQPVEVELKGFRGPVHAYQL
jgi:class 3 adenylate cyclase